MPPPAQVNKRLSYSKPHRLARFPERSQTPCNTAARPGPPNGGQPIPDFTPVPRKYRHHGWTAERQRAFIAALAELGSVKAAAHRINMSPEGAYYLRRQPGADEFRDAWAAALDHGVQRLIDIACRARPKASLSPSSTAANNAARNARTTTGC